MKIDCTFKVVFALVLALILPLRGFGMESTNCVSGSNAPHAVEHTSMQGHGHHHSDERGSSDHAMHDGADHDTSSSHHGTCSNCCCTASITVYSIQWSTSSQGISPILGPKLPAPLTVILDGLDRPPRSILA